jgi:hypothetical protein
LGLNFEPRFRGFLFAWWAILGGLRKWFIFMRFTGNTSSNVSTNGVVVVCGGDVVFCMEDVDSRQWSGCGGGRVLTHLPAAGNLEGVDQRGAGHFMRPRRPEA